MLATKLVRHHLSPRPFAWIACETALLATVQRVGRLATTLAARRGFGAGPRRGKKSGVSWRMRTVSNETDVAPKRRVVALIGSGLSEDILQIAHEHVASHAARCALTRLAASGQRRSKRAPILPACRTEEEHEGALFGLAVHLRLYGERKMMLGANAPTEIVSPCEVPLVFVGGVFASAGECLTRLQ